MTTHNPKQTIEQLKVILSNPSKKIGFLFGAGISAKYKDGKDLIPTSQQLLTTLRGIYNTEEKVAVSKIESEVGKKNFNIETLLSKISEKEQAVGTEKLCGLDKRKLQQLRKNTEDQIRKLVSVHIDSGFKNDNINHLELARWIKNSNRKFAIEIFTTNYDYLLEISFEKHNVPYFDGFIGSYKAFFHPEWIERGNAVKEWTKLWKLHGSLGWTLEDKAIVRISDTNNCAMIYPSYLKYDHSRKQPYLSYMDRLSDFIIQEDSVLFICGYSFGDEHINDTIVNALSRSRSSHVIVLKRGELIANETMTELALNNSKMSIYAKRSAVIGGKLKDWKLIKEPDKNESYNILDHGFKEDAVDPHSEWTGKGEFILGDFKDFTNFLSLFYNNSKYITI